MDRTQKKCLLASTGVHLLLGLILVFGPAFASSKRASDDIPILDFVPVKTVDALMSGGGYRDGRPPAPAPVAHTPPPPAQPPPPVEKRRDPEPLKEAAPKENSESLVPSTQPKPRFEISTNLVTRKRDSNDAKTRAEAKARDEARAQAETRRQLARQIGKVAERIGEEVSASTSIKLLGPGGGGVPYANFLQAVKTVYQDAWVVPDGVADDQATAVASVTIARDGTVLRSHIVSRSGIPLVDHSVQAVLDRVKIAAPLPDDAKENERTVTINFNVRAKQGLG